MLYTLGALTLDTRPFSVESMERDADAAVVAKLVMGILPPKEFMGEGEEDITLSGQLLPLKIGGLDELEIAHEMRRKGARFPVQRGDGWRPGWYAITKVRERHEDLTRQGVGFVVKHTITMVKVQPDAGAGQQIISGLLISLFDGLR